MSTNWIAAHSSSTVKEVNLYSTREASVIIVVGTMVVDAFSGPAELEKIPVRSQTCTDSERPAPMPALMLTWARDLDTGTSDFAMYRRREDARELSARRELA